MEETDKRQSAAEKYTRVGHPSVEELIAEQGTKFPTDPAELLGDFWPEEKSIEDFLQGSQSRDIDRFNLSDIFEYMSEDNYRHLLEQLVGRGRKGGRLAYWNMLVPRSRPESMADRLRPLPELSQKLHLQDKAFFYSRFIVEEIL